MARPLYTELDELSIARIACAGSAALAHPAIVPSSVAKMKLAERGVGSVGPTTVNAVVTLFATIPVQEPPALPPAPGTVGFNVAFGVPSAAPGVLLDAYTVEVPVPALHVQNGLAADVASPQELTRRGSVKSATPC